MKRRQIGWERDKAVDEQSQSSTLPSHLAPAARAYIECKISKERMDELTNFLAVNAQGAFTLNQELGWYVLEFSDGGDLEAVRQRFPKLISAWRDLP